MGMAHSYSIDRNLFAHHSYPLFELLPTSLLSNFGKRKTRRPLPIISRNGISHLVGGDFLALVQCCLHLLCYLRTQFLFPEGLYDCAKRFPYGNSPSRLSFP